MIAVLLEELRKGREVSSMLTPPALVGYDLCYIWATTRQQGRSARATQRLLKASGLLYLHPCAK